MGKLNETGWFEDVLQGVQLAHGKRTLLLFVADEDVFGADGNQIGLVQFRLGDDLEIRRPMDHDQAVSAFDQVFSVGGEAEVRPCPGFADVYPVRGKKPFIPISKYLQSCNEVSFTSFPLLRSHKRSF